MWHNYPVIKKTSVPKETKAEISPVSPQDHELFCPFALPSAPALRPALPCSHFYCPNLTNLCYCPIADHREHQQHKYLSQHVSAQLPSSLCHVAVSRLTGLARAFTAPHKLCARRAASSYAVHMLFGLAGSCLLPKVRDNGKEGSDLQHMLLLEGVYDTVLQTDEFSLLALPWDLLHAMFPSEDIVFPTRMANPRNRNRCRITLNLIVCVRLLGHPCWTCIHTLGQVSKKAHRKEAKVGNSGNLIYYQHEKEALLKVLGMSTNSEKMATSI